ncbi:MAG: acetyl-CoA acetyltransferase [Myxococcota bacterium]|nr:acetyl-CoA acetyltransferase [Myxococcota bacterium]
MHPQTPVLVGACAVQQRCEHPDDGVEPVELMARALEGAAEDAGSRALLGLADGVRVPRGFWDYSDPARLVAERLGASGARTQLAQIGVLQTALLGRAAADIASGRASVVLVAGGETKHRAQCAQRLGVAERRTAQTGVAPDEVLEPHREVVHPRELELGIAMPVNQYAVVENALRAADGQDLETHRDAVARLWSGMSEVAARNPDAWSREVVKPEAIRDADRRNRWIAFPYTKRHNSNWNVDQAAGLILCALGTARRLGLDESRFVFPLAVADSNHMVSLAERRDLHRTPGFAHAGRAVTEAAGVAPAEAAARELYSCFPSAVRVQQRELGLDPTLPVTVTGGMAFAGGPLNNFVLQATVKMAQELRAAPGATGLVDAVSGFLTKQGVSLWASRPPEAPFRHVDVSERTAADLPTIEVVDRADGEGRLASYTVQYLGGEPVRSILLLDLDDGRRVLRADDDPGLLAALTEEEWIGRRLPAG